ncbi:type II secretion system F family protein [Patescibacteria group bacterium]|nr:type II secretion system F family protein [Patescibacteria group bacterium]
MTAFVGKIRDSFSDFWFEVDLFFSKLFHKKKKAADQQISELTNQQADKPLDQPLDKPVEAKKETVKNSKKKLPFAIKMLRMTGKTRLQFYDEMATLVGSGVTLIDALSLVKAQTSNKGLKKLYGEMIHDINTGMSLAESMYEFPHIFPKMQAALVEAAEKSGNLKTVMAELAEEMEADQDFSRKITGAMFYPVILLVLAIGMVVGMMIFVIPKIAKMYEQSNTDLPLITQKVIDISHFITTQWPTLLMGIAGTVFVLWILFSKTKIGKLGWENFVSIVPVAGKLSKQKNLMMFASNMSMLMKSGVLISDAFAITQKTISNLHYQKEIEKIRNGIIMGREVSEMMGLEDIKAQKFKNNRYFPLQVAQLMHIGETTGTISEMLMKIKKNYHKSIDYTLRNISTLVEPIMIFIVAALVGSILLAVMMPFFYIGTTIS